MYHRRLKGSSGWYRGDTPWKLRKCNIISTPASQRSLLPFSGHFIPLKPAVKSQTNPPGFTLCFEASQGLFSNFNEGFVTFNLGERFVGKSDSSLNLEIQTGVSRDRPQTGRDFQDLGPTQNGNRATAFNRAALLRVSFPEIKYIYIHTHTHPPPQVRKSLMQYYNSYVKVENKV